MPKLLEKIQDLEVASKSGLAIVEFWKAQINSHGEDIATEFYKDHLGLNHLETKSVVWEGMTLSREPSAIEKLCVKSVHAAQEAGKESVKTVLLKVRLELIDEGIKDIAKLSPAYYHTLVLNVSKDNRSDLRDELAKIFSRGRKLVAQELDAQKSKSNVGHETKDLSDDEDELLDDLADLTDARVANDVQARIISATARYKLLGLEGSDLDDAVRKEVEEGSTSWLERAAIGATNKVLNEGRSAEMKDSADSIERYEQSELLDQNTCSPCAEDDGLTASDPDDLPGAPNPDCEGGDYCRGFIVAIAA